jgi:hypothetical protein
VNSKAELAFESNAAHKRLARIISVPSKAPRGKKSDIYLDELAHYVNDREVYRGDGRLVAGKVSFDAERTTRGGHADRFWAIALACQKGRGPAPKTGTEIGVRPGTQNRDRDRGAGRGLRFAPRSVLASPFK